MLPNKGLTIHSPGTYEIRVQGYVDASWSEYVGGVNLRIQSQSDEPPVTAIRGEFDDQAALTGALNHLTDLGFPLLSVALIGSGPQGES
jgi:hypothetical protein